MIIQLYIAILIVLIIPLLTLFHFLWQHRKENGNTQVLRKIIMMGTLLKILFFVVEITAMVNVLVQNTHPLIWNTVARIVTVSMLAAFNWWALFKIKRIQEGKL